MAAPFWELAANSSTPLAAQNALYLQPGVHVQAYDADLLAIAAATSASAVGQVLRCSGIGPVTYAWGAVNLADTDAVTGILTSAFGGTGNGFTKFTGPATAERTFTLPNASATILTDNAAVTVAQGGTGVATLTNHGVVIGQGTSPVAITSAGTSGQVLTSNGASADPTFQSVRIPFVGGCQGTTIAAGLTRYFNQTLNATEAFVYLPVPFAGTFKNLFVYSTAAPGVGQTYTFTLRNTLADTAVTCQIAGAASNSASDTTHTAAFAAGDKFAIKVVMSGGATTDTFIFGIEFDAP